jgi:hypothetical protein
MVHSACATVTNSARGRIAAQAKRQTTTAVNKAASDMFTVWTGAMTGAPAQERKRKR